MTPDEVLRRLRNRGLLDLLEEVESDEGITSARVAARVRTILAGGR